MAAFWSFWRQLCRKLSYKTQTDTGGHRESGSGATFSVFDLICADSLLKWFQYIYNTWYDIGKLALSIPCSINHLPLVYTGRWATYTCRDALDPFVLFWVFFEQNKSNLKRIVMLQKKKKKQSLGRYSAENSAWSLRLTVPSSTGSRVSACQSFSSKNLSVFEWYAAYCLDCKEY